MAKNGVDYYLNRLADLKAERVPWEPQWQLLGDFINLRRNSFTQDGMAGEFLGSELFDSSASKAMEASASALLAMTWPSGGRSIKLDPTEYFDDDQDAQEWFSFATRALAEEMDDVRAGFITSYDQFLQDWLSLSTSCLVPLPNSNPDQSNILSFQAWSLEGLFIDESDSGMVDTVYREYKRTVKQLVDRFGLENVHKSVAEKYRNGKYGEKITIVHCIEPRMVKDKSAKGNLNMKIASVTIDTEHKHILKESGFEEMAALVSRFRKKANEKYGRGPGFNALPDAMEANAIWEAVTIAIEKQLDPALAVLDDGKLGGGVINTSAGAINVFRVSGRAGVNESPVRRLVDTGQVDDAVNLISELRDSINQAFFVDRLLDTNDDKQMTLGEAEIRDGKSARAMVSPIMRLATEVLTPTVERCFNICLRANRFGYIKGSPEAIAAESMGRKIRYIPDSVVKAMEEGVNAYNVQYITPAARAMRMEEYQAIRTTVMTAIEFGMEERVNRDFGLQRTADILGAPDELLYSDAEMEERQKAQAKLQEAAMAAEASTVQAEVADKMASANLKNQQARTV